MLQWLKNLMKRKKPRNYLSKIPIHNKRELTEADKKILLERRKTYDDHVNKYGIAIIDDNYDEITK